jgi:hypothetical protein
MFLLGINNNGGKTVEQRIKKKKSKPPSHGVSSGLEFFRIFFFLLTLDLHVPKYHRIPNHNIVVERGCENTVRRLILHSLQISNETSASRRGHGGRGSALQQTVAGRPVREAKNYPPFLLVPILCILLRFKNTRFRGNLSWLKYDSYKTNLTFSHKSRQRKVCWQKERSFK